MEKMLIQNKANEKAKLKGFRLYQNDITRLEEISKKLGKNKSEVIRELIEIRYESLFDDELIRMYKLLDMIMKAVIKKDEEMTKTKINDTLKKAKGSTV